MKIDKRNFIYVFTIFAGLVFFYYNIFEIAFSHLIKFYPRYFVFLGCFYFSIYFFNFSKLISFLFIIFGFIWFLTYKSLIGYVSNLGTDSFFETSSFGYVEFQFWVKTFISNINLFISLKEFIFLILLVFTFILIQYFLFFKRIIKQKKIFNILNAILIVLPLTISLINLKNIFVDKNEIIKNIRENFSYSSEKLISDNENINLIVYIGEATTSLNINLYGYFRNTFKKTRGIE